MLLYLSPAQEVLCCGFPHTTQEVQARLARPSPDLLHAQYLAAPGPFRIHVLLVRLLVPLSASLHAPETNHMSPSSHYTAEARSGDMRKIQDSTFSTFSSLGLDGKPHISARPARLTVTRPTRLASDRCTPPSLQCATLCFFRKGQMRMQ